MMKLRPQPLVPFAALFIAASHLSTAQAARPMEIDDAGIVDPEQCQIESWADVRRSQSTYWVMPACNVQGEWEVSAGAAWQRNSGYNNAEIFAIQGKRVIKENLFESTDIALSAEYEHHHQTADRARNWAINLPATTTIESAGWLWHNNLGMVFDSHNNDWQVTWGTGLETEIAENINLYAEVFGETGGERPSFQIAGGYWLKPDALQITLGVGDNLEVNSRSRWLSLGINWFGKIK